MAPTRLPLDSSGSSRPRRRWLGRAFPPPPTTSPRPWASAPDPQATPGSPGKEGASLALHPEATAGPPTWSSPPREPLLAGVAIPVVGRIPAGPPELALEEAEGLIALPGWPGLFALVVEGDSMAEYLLEGDVVVVEAGVRPRRGEIAAVLYEGRDHPQVRLPRGGGGGAQAPQPRLPHPAPSRGGGGGAGVFPLPPKGEGGLEAACGFFRGGQPMTHWSPFPRQLTDGQRGHAIWLLRLLMPSEERLAVAIRPELYRQTLTEETDGRTYLRPCRGREEAFVVSLGQPWPRSERHALQRRRGCVGPSQAAQGRRWRAEVLPPSG